GDVCVRTTLEDETLNYLDDLFDLSKPANYWALGNHDVMYKHPERIEKRTHRNSWYAHYNNGFTVLVINTSLDKLYSRDALCAERKQQFEMIKNVCDTIVKSTHLVLLMHHVLWFEIDTKYWIYTNELKSSWRATCDSASTFKNAVYPLLQAVQQKGIQVLCIAGDVGLKKKKHGSYRSDEGIQFLACGLGDGHYYREQKDSIHNDQVLILRHNLRDSSLSWGFHNLDSLLGEQLVLY
ncbi:MAG: hypothetical protein ACE5DN_06395, partial [Flavobacteriales bacterium]